MRLRAHTCLRVLVLALSLSHPSTPRHLQVVLITIPTPYWRLFNERISWHCLQTSLSGPSRCRGFSVLSFWVHFLPHPRWSVLYFSHNRRHSLVLATLLHTVWLFQLAQPSLTLFLTGIGERNVSLGQVTTLEAGGCLTSRSWDSFFVSTFYSGTELWLTSPKKYNQDLSFSVCKVIDTHFQNL